MKQQQSKSPTGTTISSYAQAMAQAQTNRASRKYPGEGDQRSRNGNLFPEWNPSFRLKLGPDIMVFTIGSCFARNIEEALIPFQVQLPTRALQVPKSEWPHRPNGLLNEFNPGTISQRILHALDGRSHAINTVVPGPNGFADLLLLGCSDVSYERAMERRMEIDAIYANLKHSDLVIITLGLIEAWFDNESGSYLNRMPPNGFAIQSAGRFELRQLGVEECLSLLFPAFEALISNGTRIILTVSPVPLGLTFSGRDCMVANEHSKSVLRVCAHELSQMSGVEYFPSYEVVRTGGLPNFESDHLHVKDAVVKEITRLMTGLLMPDE